MTVRNKLVILNQDVGYLFVDLANAALDHYDEVVLLTGSVVELGSQLDGRVVVRKIFRYQRRSVYSRLKSWLLGFFQVLWLLATRYRQHDVLVATNPPLNGLLPMLVSNRMGLYVLDLYPEALHTTGLVSPKNAIFRVWGWLNRLSYRRFSAIWVLTPSMRESVEKHYQVSVRLGPAWAAEVIANSDEDFLDNEKLSGRWIVLYSGNMGREHDVEVLLDCAAKLRDCEGLTFVIAGEGWKKEMIEDRISVENLSNVRLLPKLPAGQFSALLMAAKVGVVTQSSRTADVCIPSKTFNLLSYGLPIMGIGEPDSDFGRLVENNGAGRVFKKQQAAEIAEFLRLNWQDDAELSGLRNHAADTAKSFTKANADRLVEEFTLDLRT